MIRRPRDLVAIPAVLGPADTRAARERIRATNHYGVNEPPAKNMKFSAYSDDEVKNALDRLFGHKCAYCESDYGPTGPVDVEHYRPKGGVMIFDGTIRFPGYWWLGSTWTNLLPSCIDCNRSRWHKVGHGRYKYGKENRFPLAGGALPATTAAGVMLEQPLLLDPASDEPSYHLVFHFELSPEGKPESVVKPVVAVGAVEDARGIASIETYGLNRPLLSRSRRRRIMELQGALSGVEELLILAEEEADPQRKAKIMGKVRVQMRGVVRNYLIWSCEYAAACRSYFRLWREELQTA